ncbi:unnamed protein product [Dimorphilus gyrociliatus]|uniref:Uncharacterized protein n=1 Tax=Dimorphilus gyrociliatus TaxID=2664684 RepID=A0A7I8W9E4_9ANNE|nr:unnamed protein product [Dimorphilus gyrociliatus]
MRFFTAEKLLDEWEESITRELEDGVAETRRKIKKYLTMIENDYSPKADNRKGMGLINEIRKVDVEAHIKNIYIGAVGNMSEKNGIT